MKRLLFVSIAAPPKSGPESLQTGKYLRELSHHFAIDLVTTKPPKHGWNKSFGTVQKNLLPYLNNLIELNNLDGKVMFRLKHFLPEKVLFPDEKFHFHLSAQKVIKRLKNEPDVIYSRSAPLSSAIMAYKLKKKLQKPWIMHLSDPWSDNPFITSNKERNILWERKCFVLADAITVTNEVYQQWLVKKYPEFKNKIFISYNVYGNVLPRMKMLPPTLKIVYFGNFYGNRTPYSVLKAIDLLYKEKPKLFAKVQINFYGNTDKNSLQTIKKFTLPFVKHQGHVNSNKIPELIKDSLVLLNIEDDFRDLHQNFFLPSKIMDYMASQRLILSIASSKSPSKAIVSKGYGYSFSHNETEKVANFFDEAIQAFNQQDYSFFTVLKPDQKYSSEYQSAKLKELILSLI